MKSLNNRIKITLIPVIIIGFLFSPLLMKTGNGGDSLEAVQIGSESRNSLLLKHFKTRHNEIAQQVADGKYLESVGADADKLWISLQKDLIDHNAIIEKYKIEAREYSGPKQEEALNNLVRASALREQTISNYLQKLEELVETHLNSPQADETNSLSPDPEKAKKDNAKPRKKEPADYADPEKAALETGKKEKGLDIEIIIEPENIIKEEQIAE